MKARAISTLTPLLLACALSSLRAQTAKKYDHGDPTPSEQLMLELVNRARANPEAEARRLGIGLNEGLGLMGISKEPKAPLAFHPALLAAARSHTRWMLESGKFSHEGVGGSTAGQRMTSAGYVFSGTWSQAENISFGSSSSSGGGGSDPLKRTMERYGAWFKSPPHRKNMFSPDNREFGTGIVEGRFKGADAVLATQDFASSESYSSPMLLGVVFADRNGNGFYDPGEGLPGVTVVPEGGDWTASTSASGGYALPYPVGKGELGVTFSGGRLGRPIRLELLRTGKNVKLDLISPAAAH